MNALDRPVSLIDALRTRRQRLAELIDSPILLWSGKSSSRNFPANKYPFRASSHFLYFAGLPLENVAIRLFQGKLSLFMDAATPASTLWHGESPTPTTIAATIGADEVYPLSQLPAQAKGCATIPVQDEQTRTWQREVLGRSLLPLEQAKGQDWALAQAIVQLRLTHDAAALAELRQAAAISVQAHLAGMAATRTAKTEAAVRAAMEAVMIAQQATPAYTSIVTMQGEVLHNDRSHLPLRSGELLLADVGAEVSSGWAADITRTWAVSGKFSPTQRAIYSVVLEAHDRAIAAMHPGVEYRDIHLLAGETIAAGLVDLGILHGDPSDLVAQDAHALFFPHGIGHLLGLDVHDMEDLGDLAGYASGKTRSDRFGLGYLRLDRPLQPGMLVTIEPGFYQVPALLNDLDRRAKYDHVVNWGRLAEFADVRGIRIEDDVLLTETGTEVLTADLPTTIEDLEIISTNGFVSK